MTAFLPKVISEVNLDVTYQLPPNVWTRISGSARVEQLSYILVKLPVAIDTIDVTYRPSGGILTDARGASVYQLPVDSLKVPVAFVQLDVQYQVGLPVHSKLEGRAIVSSRVGSFINVPVAFDILDRNFRCTGGAKASGGARWQTANYHSSSLIGGVVVSGTGAVEFARAERDFVTSAFFIDIGDWFGFDEGTGFSFGGRRRFTFGSGGGGGGGGGDGEGGTGGPDEPIDLNGFKPSTDMLTGSGGLVITGKVNMYGGQVIYYGTARRILQKQDGHPVDLTIEFDGEFTDPSGMSLLGIDDLNNPGFGGWDPDSSGTGLSFSGFDLSTDRITFIDRTTGVPGGLVTLDGGLFTDRGLHARLPVLQCSIDAFLDWRAFDAALTPLISTIDAILGVRATISAQLPPMSAQLGDGSAQVEIQLPLLTSTVQAIHGVRGTISTTLRPLTSTIQANLGVRGTIGAVLTSLSSTIQLQKVDSGTISAQLKPPTCSIYAMNVGTINATLTRLSSAFTVAGIISARLTRISSAINVGGASNAQLQIMVVNTHTTAISTYEDYPFNSYCEIGGVYFAASATGLHQIDVGSTDAGQPISAGIGTGIMNFGDSLQKRMYDSFATMRSIGGINMIVIVDAGARHPPKTISMVPRAVTTGLVKYRGIMPKGLRGEAWQFELNNVTGSPFDFNGLSVLDVPASRHI